jgi:hypothetical protein
MYSIAVGGFGWVVLVGIIVERADFFSQIQEPDTGHGKDDTVNEQDAPLSKFWGATLP